MNPSTESRGVIYAAVGKKYIRSAILSARSVRQHNPGLPIHLFADWQEQGFDFTHSPDPFTSVAGIASPHYRSKVDLTVETPFDRTLYLDTDTRILADITPLFDLLDRFDIALAHAPNRLTRLKNWQEPVPESFPQFNTGVMLYRRTPPVWDFLNQWVSAFHQAGFFSDQITFRELIWKSDLRIATLAQEYNLRDLKYFLIWSRREARPKILHLPLYNQGIFYNLARSRRVLHHHLGLQKPPRHVRRPQPKNSREEQ